MRIDDNIKMMVQWDEIARINAYYGVDSSPEFEGSEINKQEFFSKGRIIADEFLKQLDLNDCIDKTIVEIGCGLGRMSHFFSERFKKVYALDVSAEMIKRSRKEWGNLKNIEFILGSGEDLKPVPDSAVDLVFSFIVLQHVLKPEIVLNYIYETGRVLKKHGKAFLQFRTYTPEKSENHFYITKIIPSAVKKFLRNTVLKKKVEIARQKEYNDLEEKLNNEFTVWHGCSVSIYDVEEAVTRAGLKIVNLSGVNTQYTYYTFVKE
jgi:ubiquinone/menaquinone biosynthesis C-methylase UbiE